MVKFIMKYKLAFLILILAGCSNNDIASDDLQKDKQEAKQTSDDSTKNTQETEQEELPFDQLIFQILKNNDASAIHKIALSAEQEEFFRANTNPNLDPNLSERSIKGCTLTLEKLHEDSAKIGFDWSNAKLLRTVCHGTKIGSVMKDYHPDLDDLGDMGMVIESGGKIVGVHVDDCLTIRPGEHVVGDGFRFLPDPEIPEGFLDSVDGSDND